MRSSRQRPHCQSSLQTVELWQARHPGRGGVSGLLPDAARKTSRRAIMGACKGGLNGLLQLLDNQDFVSFLSDLDGSNVLNHVCVRLFRISKALMREHDRSFSSIHAEIVHFCGFGRLFFFNLCDHFHTVQLFLVYSLNPPSVSSPSSQQAWPLCFAFLSFLSLPVCGVELADALPFLAERGGCASAITFTSSGSASCTEHKEGEDKKRHVRG